MYAKANDLVPSSIRSQNCDRLTHAQMHANSVLLAQRSSTILNHQIHPGAVLSRAFTYEWGRAASLQRDSSARSLPVPYGRHGKLLSIIRRVGAGDLLPGGLG